MSINHFKVFLKSHDLHKNIGQVLERQKEKTKRCFNSARQEAAAWVQLASRLEWVNPRNKGARRGVVLGYVAPSWRAVWGDLETPQQPPIPWQMMGCSGADSLQKVWALHLRAGLPESALCLCLPCQDKIPRSGHTLLLLTAALQSALSLFLQQKAVFTHTHSHLAFSN